jgi:DNA end-binding protein Ku
VAIAAMTIKRKAGHIRPSTFRDRYQDALRELIEAKMRGLPVKVRAEVRPPPVLDLMAALKRSLAEESGDTRRQQPKPKRRTASDRRQRNLLLPVSGGQTREPDGAAQRGPTRQRKKA